jgi:chromosome segregation ATPase
LSTLGKILTVLVALVSIAVAVLVAREFVQTKNWKALQEEQIKLTSQAMDSLATAIKAKNDQLQKWEADKAALDGQINALSTDREAKMKEVADLAKQIGGQKASLDEMLGQLKALQAGLTNLVKEKDGYRSERDLAMKRADDFTIMYNELEVKYRTDEANLNSMKDLLRQAQEDKAALEGQLFFFKQENPQAKMPEKAAPGPLPRVSGLITAIDNEARTGQINMGSDTGIVKGMKFIIYSEPNTYLATLTITTVGNNKAAGTLTVISGTVKASDHVTNKYID